MKCNKETFLLYAVTDRTWTHRQSLFEQVEAALWGGVTCVQLREKELCVDDFLEEAKGIKKLCQSFGVPLIINDNVKLAIECGADGVHVGINDAPVSQIRAAAPENFIIGATAKTAEQAQAAMESGADYIGVGAVFPSPTKKDAVRITHEQLRKICSSVSIPSVAIGGITKENIMSLAGSGVDGVALVSAIFASEDIKNECEQLLSLSMEMISKK